LIAELALVAHLVDIEVLQQFQELLEARARLEDPTNVDHIFDQLVDKQVRK
jgi:hypothetical protein